MTPLENFILKLVPALIISAILVIAKRFLYPAKKTIKVNELQDKAQLEIWSKHFKRYYKGQPTKRFKRLSSIIAMVNNYTENDFFSLQKRRFF